MDALDVVQIGFFVSLAKAAVSVVMFSTITFLLLRLANKLSGVHFDTAFITLSENPMALSVYLSARYAVLGLGNAYIIASNFMY